MQLFPRFPHFSKTGPNEAGARLNKVYMDTQASLFPVPMLPDP
jgi:hypothetical protein